MTRSARGRLVIERGAQAVEEWQDDHGELSDDERTAADALLDELLGTSRRRSA